VRKIGVYAITCLATGERYVGSTMDLRARWGNHKTFLNQGVHSSKKMQESWNKYGPAQFTCELIQEVNSETLKEAFRALAIDLVAAEQKAMNEGKPAFNVATNAGLATQKNRNSWWVEGGERADEARKKISAYRSGKTGFKFSAESIEKRASKLRGRKHTPEAIARMSVAKKGKPVKGHPCSPEQRAKLSTAMKTRHAAKKA
jgi:Straboviridae intron-associated endonuclease 1